MENRLDILFVQPNYRQIYSYAGSKTLTPIYPPLGMAYIAAVLREKGFRVKILEANAFDLDYGDIKRIIEKEHPRYVAFTASTSLMEEISKLCDLVPDNVKIILGGVHASSLPEETLRDFSRIDICVIGEGEITMNELMEGKPLDEIKGIAFRSNGTVIRNEPREWIMDLNEMPFPARDLLPMEKYYAAFAQKRRMDYVVSGRGCPYRCTFCADHLTTGRLFRMRSAESIVAEIEHLVENYNVQEIDFMDDNFTLIYDRVEKFCDLMIKKGLHKKVIWRCSNGIRVDKVTPELLRKMKKAGCYMVSLGIESGNDKILIKMRKGITTEQVRRAARWCKDAGIKTRGLFIFGNMGENRGTMLDTIRLAKELPLDEATFHVAIPMPKTELWETIQREGKLLDQGWTQYTAYSTGAFVLGDVNPKLMSEMQKRAYREFYFRPKYMVKRVMQIRSVREVMRLVKAGLEGVKFISG